MWIFPLGLRSIFSRSLPLKLCLCLILYHSIKLNHHLFFLLMGLLSGSGTRPGNIWVSKNSSEKNHLCDFSISWTNRKEEETTRGIQVEGKTLTLNLQEDGTEVLYPRKSTKSTTRSLQSKERRFLKKQKSTQARGSTHHHDNHIKNQQPRPTQPYSQKHIWLNLDFFFQLNLLPPYSLCLHGNDCSILLRSDLQNCTWYNQW